MRVKALHPVRQQAHALQKVMRNQRTEHIQLKVTRSAAHVDGHIIAKDLTAEHGQGLALGRVDFARHDGRTRFVFRDAEFAQTTARPTGQPAHIVGYFHQTSGQRFERAMCMHQRIGRGQRLKLIGRGDKRQTRQTR